MWRGQGRGLSPGLLDVKADLHLGMVSPKVQRRHAQVPRAMSGIPVFSVPRDMNSLAWVLMESLVCFRYRNCVYTYRILPNEDDKFTVQVSPLSTRPSGLE